MGKALIDDREVGRLNLHGEDPRWGKFRFGIEINPETKLVTKAAAPLKMMVGWTLHGVETYAIRKGWGVERRSVRGQRGRLLDVRKGKFMSRTAQRSKTDLYL